LTPTHQICCFSKTYKVLDFTYRGVYQLLIRFRYTQNRPFGFPQRTVLRIFRYWYKRQPVGPVIPYAFERRGRCPHRPASRRYRRVRLFWPFWRRTRRDDLGIVPYVGDARCFGRVLSSPIPGNTKPGSSFPCGRCFFLLAVSPKNVCLQRIHIAICLFGCYNCRKRDCRCTGDSVAPVFSAFFRRKRREEGK